LTPDPVTGEVQAASRKHRRWFADMELLLDGFVRESLGLCPNLIREF
jgi:hypothetical protein